MYELTTGMGGNLDQSMYIHSLPFVSSILGMWSTLSAKMTKQENRNTVIEKDIYIKEIVEVCKQKLRETVG